MLRLLTLLALLTLPVWAHEAYFVSVYAGQSHLWNLSQTDLGRCYWRLTRHGPQKCFYLRDPQSGDELTVVYREKRPARLKVIRAGRSYLAPSGRVEARQDGQHLQISYESSQGLRAEIWMDLTGAP